MTGIIPWEQPIEYPITLESLQAMPDAELNELSAVKVMGWEVHWQPFFPITDTNDAMKLVNVLDAHFELNISDGLSTVSFVTEDPIEGYRYLSQVSGESPTRCITIASILAKGETQ